MNTLKTTGLRRNQSMEIAKMVAAFLFCLAHLGESSPVSSIANRLASFGLPLFFAISGYFSYGASCEKLARRLAHILRLYLIAYVVHLISMCVLIELNGGSTIAYLRAAVPDWDEMILWSVVQHDSFLGHLWTLASTAICYILLWMYTRFSKEQKPDYSPLYILSCVLFMVYMTMSTILPIIGIEVHYLAYRNAWFMGIPCFSLGIFLNQYCDRIREAFDFSVGKLAAITFFSYLLVTAGFDILFPLEIVSLMLLLIAAPRIRGGGLEKLQINVAFGLQVFIFFTSP